MKVTTELDPNQLSRDGEAFKTALLSYSTDQLGWMLYHAQGFYDLMKIMARPGAPVHIEITRMMLMLQWLIPAFQATKEWKEAIEAAGGQLPDEGEG